MGSIFTSETVIAAILGSAFTLLIGWCLQNRKEKRILRQTIVGQLCSRTYEMIAALIELYSALAHSGSKDEEKKCLANFTKLEGAAMEFEITIWRAFKHRRVRAAYHKLLNRIDKTKDLITHKDIPSEQNVNLAINWIEAQCSKTTLFASQAASINMRDPARIAFLGLNPRKWNDEIQNLSFKDEPPPWIFDLQINFSTKKLSPIALQNIKENICRKVGDMRCHNHRQAAHIYLHGRGPENFDFQVAACCEEFIESVRRKIVKDKSEM